MEMFIQELSIQDIDISEFNTRKDLVNGQADSTLDDLARSIEKPGTAEPYNRLSQNGGRYALIAGQRRLVACHKLGKATIPAIVRDALDAKEAPASRSLKMFIARTGTRTKLDEVRCYALALSIFCRRLNGRMSVHTWPMYSKHSDLVPVLPASRHPSGKSRWAGQIEYCSS